MTTPRRLAVLALTLAACSSGKKETTCYESGCPSGFVCEAVTSASPACFEPVLVRGRVFDLATDAGLDGARVVALDVDGGPASAVVISATTGTPATPGTYELRVPAERAADGTPVSAVTLRADRAGYQSFPSGLRVALPVATNGATHEAGKWVVSSSQTGIGLRSLPGAPTGSIAGTVRLPSSGVGVLVVAEKTTTGASATAVPGSDGSFRIFNLADGTYEVRAYARGVQYAPAPATAAVDVAGSQPEPSVAFNPVAAATATVGGSMIFASTGGLTDPKTSVILVVASTFDEARVRGAAPAGLRAGNIIGPWSIAGVPDGHYRVLAGFETDYLVRDPSDIGGTAVLELQVVNGVPLRMDGVTSAANIGSFKVTDAVQLTAPLPDPSGACATLPLPTDPAALPAGACLTAVADAAIGWDSYSSQDFFEVTVVDELGAVVWQAQIDKLATGTTYGSTGAEVDATLVSAAPLEPGRTYQARVAAKNFPKTAGAAEETLSSSEDLLGVFTYEPPTP
jgi:hypothetical protein